MFFAEIRVTWTKKAEITQRFDLNEFSNYVSSN